MAATEARPRDYWTRERAIEAIQEFHREHGRTPTQAELRSPLPSNVVLRRIFGTMGEAVRAAGFEPRGTGGARTSASPPSPEAPEPEEAPQAHENGKQAANADSAPEHGLRPTLVDRARAVEDAREAVAGYQQLLEQAQRDLATFVDELREAVEEVAA